MDLAYFSALTVNQVLYKKLQSSRETLREAIEDIEKISILIRKWEDSEKKLLETKSIYDHFDQIILQDRHNTGAEEIENSCGGSLKKISSKSSAISSNSKNCRNKNLSRNTADMKSKSSLNTHLGKRDSSSCSKTVERRIHQIENYENILRQYKAPIEKVPEMDVTYTYQKKRSEFGRQCLFSDRGPDLIDNYPSNKKLAREFILRDPVHRSTLCAPVQAEHYLNTMRAEYANSSVNHVEGGWPKDVNIADEEQTKRYRRKIEKDEGFNHTMMQLFKSMENCILQNNAINIYQQYFSDVEPTPLVERSSARTVNVYQDQSSPTRPVNWISWSPDNQTKLAITHCNLKFQSAVPKETTFSYIWEVENPNRPLLTLKPEYSCVCLEYNQKDPHSLVSGQLNGQVAVWDTRKGYEPVELSLAENSFRDPVHSILWINSKSGTEFFSASTDGQVKWWDTRKLTEPTETLILDYAKDEEQNVANAFGASCLEYETTIPTRFMCGTEQGVVISCNRKGKTAMEKMAARFKTHMGPVLALQRNPAFVKNFLTIGDWSARIWSEDCRESWITWTGFHKAMLTDGAWSPTRLSVFFTTRTDGILDVWDVLQEQKQASLSVKVCDEKLRRIRTHDMGRLVAVGNQKGTTYLVEFSENLATSNKNDKMLLTAMFERESRREKILEARSRELRLKQKTKQPQQGEAIDEEQIQENIEVLSEQVFADSMVKQAELEFYETFEKEKKAEQPEEEEEKDKEVTEMGSVMEVQDEETATESPPPPTPEPEPAKKEGKGKKKGK